MIEYDVPPPEGDSVTLHLRGDLEGFVSAERFKVVLEQHYLNDGIKRVNVDLSRVDHVTLEGIAVLLALRAESLRRGKVFRIVGPEGAVRERLYTTGVLRFLEQGEGAS